MKVMIVRVGAESPEYLEAERVSVFMPHPEVEGATLDLTLTPEGLSLSAQHPGCAEQDDGKDFLDVWEMWSDLPLRLGLDVNDFLEEEDV